jgi:uncharacterized DUF497 family protein
MIYEWDERKRTANLEKHGLDLAEAWKVFESVRNISFRHAKRKERRAFDAALKNR